MKQSSAPRPAPETPRQAALFTVVKARYLRAGLCHGCSAQAAFAHRYSWREVKPPCAVCRRVVNRLPIPQCNGWRSIPSRAQQGQGGTSSALGSTATPPGAQNVHGRGEEA